MSEWKETELGVIPSHWQFKFIKDLIHENIILKPKDGNHGGKHPKGSDFCSEGIPFIMATDINNGKINLSNCKYISKDLADSLDKGFSMMGDVLLTHKASLGRTAIVKDLNTPYIMLTPQVTYYRVVNSNKLNNLYLKYFFDSDVFQNTLLNHGDSGSTRAYVGITAQQNLPVILPPLPEQKAIAGVLSSLDDKIDLLHRQNKTLEAMAETLFRQWFIEEAEDDWEWVQLDEFISVNRGLSYKGSGLCSEDEGIPMHNLNSVYEGGGYKHAGIKYYSGDYKERHLVQSGDLLIANTEQGHDCLLIGYPAIVPTKYNVGIFSQHLYKLDIISPRITNIFLFYLLQSFDVREQIIGSTNGSTVNMLPKDGIEWVKFKLPPSRKILQFDIIANQIQSKIQFSLSEIENLNSQRNTLLPKLMSGEVRIAL